MAKKVKAKRKIRTREHINADLSVNYVEKIALLRGYSVERVDHDYGYDLVVFTYDHNGEIENGQIFFQLKARQDLEFIKNGEILSYQVDRKDLNLWKDEPFPVIFVVYDAQKDVAYWLHVQDYIKHTFTRQKATTQSPSLNIPRANLLNVSSMGNIAVLKESALSSINAFLNQSNS